MPIFNEAEYRKSVGAFATGVVVVTGIQDQKPLGFAAQSFISLSLDPPLVAFCPARASSSWPKMRATGRFAVNILALSQQATCNAMAQSGDDKFANVDWVPSEGGLPEIVDALAFLECDIEAEHEGGDHTIVVGRVRLHRRHREQHAPLLYFQSAYGSFGKLT